jgi:hypothetical protein
MRIRVPVLLALLLGLGAPPAVAQFGIKGGLSFATLSESDASPDFRNRTGFAVGVSLGLPLAGLLALQPEALYAEKGAGAATAAQATTLAYLDIPVLLRLNFPTPVLTPFVVAGPQASLRLRCRVGQRDCDQDFGGTDYAGAVGAGIKLQGGVRLTVEVRYTQGLKDIRNVSEGFDTRTRTFLTLVGLSF